MGEGVRAFVLVGVALCWACVGDSPGGGPDAAGGLDSSTADAGSDVAITDASDASDGGPRCNPSAPFANARLLPDINASSKYNLGARFTADELTAYFTSIRSDGGLGSFDTYVATRASLQAPFNGGTLLNGGNSTGDERWPSVTADGLNLYVARFPGGNWDIFSASRAKTTDPFPVTTNLATVSGSPANDISPYALPDNGAIYFVSDRNGNNDLFRSSNVGGVFQTPVALTGPNVNTTQTEDSPVVTPDELVLYFASDRGNGRYDMYTSRRASTSSVWGAPALVTELDGPGFEWPTWVSADDCVLVFTRTVADDAGPSSAQAIWIAERSK